MSEAPPLIFRNRLGMLAPVNAMAREAVKACDGDVIVIIKRANRNQRRRSLYWCVATVAVNVLNDLHGLDLTEAELHRETLKKLGYVTLITLPSGGVVERVDSTSDRAMQEPERAVYTNRAFAVWAKWTGVDVETLTDEGRRMDKGMAA
jgi:hypothetical protein